MSHNHRSQNRVSEHFTDEAVAVAERSYEAVGEAIRKEPVAVTLAMFGIGVALGTAAAVMLTRKPQPSTTGTLESLGKHVLDSLRDVLPDAVRQHLPR
jgi:hypothetical protein